MRRVFASLRSRSAVYGCSWTSVHVKRRGPRLFEQSRASDRSMTDPPMTTSRTVTLTQARLKQLLYYDPETGIFTWKVRTSNRVRLGDVAGTPDKKGYIIIGVDGTHYKAHVLAWLYVTGSYPSNLLDHRNRIKFDNSFTNLREATKSENGFNRDTPVNNTSGVVGVSWSKVSNAWQARIHIRGKTTHLGLFVRFEDAVLARHEAELKLFGEFRRTA